MCVLCFYLEFRKIGVSCVIFVLSVYILFVFVNNYKFCKVLNGKFVVKVIDVVKN